MRAGGQSPVRARFGRDRRIRKSAEFSGILRNGRRGTHAVLAVVAFEAAGRGRLGISAPVGVGNAVVRNRLRRQVRDIYRQAYKGHSTYDIVVSLKPSAANATIVDLGQALQQAITEAIDRGKVSHRHLGPRG